MYPHFASSANASQVGKCIDITNDNICLVVSGDRRGVLPCAAWSLGDWYESTRRDKSFQVSTSKLLTSLTINCSVKNSPSDVESRLPILSMPCPGGVRFMSWRGSSNHAENSAIPAQAASEIFPSHGQGVLQSERTSFTGDGRIAPNQSGQSTHQALSGINEDICRNRYVQRKDLFASLYCTDCL